VCVEAMPQSDDGDIALKVTLFAPEGSAMHSALHLGEEGVSEKKWGQEKAGASRGRFEERNAVWNIAVVGSAATAGRVWIALQQAQTYAQQLQQCKGSGSQQKGQQNIPKILLRVLPADPSDFPQLSTGSAPAALSSSSDDDSCNSDDGAADSSPHSNLNKSQQEAVQQVVSSRRKGHVLLIQGPPGKDDHHTCCHHPLQIRINIV